MTLYSTVDQAEAERVKRADEAVKCGYPWLYFVVKIFDQWAVVKTDRETHAIQIH